MTEYFCPNCQSRIDITNHVDGVISCQVCGTCHTIAELKQVKIDCFIYPMKRDKPVWDWDRYENSECFLKG